MARSRPVHKRPWADQSATTDWSPLDKCRVLRIHISNGLTEILIGRNRLIRYEVFHLPQSFTNPWRCHVICGRRSQQKFSLILEFFNLDLFGTRAGKPKDPISFALKTITSTQCLEGILDLLQLREPATLVLIKLSYNDFLRALMLELEDVGVLLRSYVSRFPPIYA